MKYNILTHIKTKDFLKFFEEIFREVGIVSFNIEDTEELFHAIIHANPKMFLVEIDSLEESYFKITKILSKSNMTSHVPIAVITSQDDEAFFDGVMEIEGVHVFRKPFYPSIIRNGLANILKMAYYSETMSQVQDVQDVQSVIISSLATLAEYRDPETGEHIKRTQNYVKALAMSLKKEHLFEDFLTEENIELMYMSVPLHDIGKVGIPDNILLKPGRLTSDEMEIMKTHTTLGYETITRIGNRLKNNAFLDFAADVAYTHHEWHDGTGYPKGLKGDEIPLVGRLMAIADVYDALTSKRVYKDAMSHEDALRIMKEASGTHFDPLLIKHMISIEETYRKIAQTYKDSPQDGGHGYPHTLKKLYDDRQIKNILIVEDSRIVRNILKNQLLALNFKVDEAENGEEGLRLFNKKSYDLILVDVEMPKMNGYEMATRISTLGNRETVMIAMTATDYDVTKEELNRYGISDLLLKPVDLNLLGKKFLYAKGIEAVD